MPDYSTSERRDLAKQGKALPSDDGGGRFPIRNCGDVANAIRAVGRVRPNTEEARAKVRRFIIKRSNALGCGKQIPDTWAADGTLK